MKRKVTQRTEAQVEINRLLANAKQLRSIHKNLSAILERAQNAPPHGDADGTISTQAHADLRKVEQGIESLLQAASTACW
jgi:hypothetical protein